MSSRVNNIGDDEKDENEFNDEDKELQKSHKKSMLEYLEKRNMTFPDLKRSISDFPEPGELDKIFSIKLEPDPHPLPEGELSC